MTSGRRTLRYDSLDAIMVDVDRLLEGHTTVGHWSLAQICRHLATVMRRTIELPTSTPYDASRWLGEEQKRQFFETGLVPEGIPTNAPPDAGESLVERDEVEALRRAIADYVASPGPQIPHILLGFLTREEWDRFHCIHAAHHLSFATPSGAAS